MMSTGRGQLQLVGRDHDVRAVADSLGRTPSAIFVEGEPGVGKSRLVNEALAESNPKSSIVVVARCRPETVSLPGALLMDSLRSCEAEIGDRPSFATLSTTLRSLAAELDECAHAVSVDSAAQYRLCRAVHESLSSLGRAVLVVEDLQWADSASLRVLRYLVSSPPPGLSVVMTCRPDELSRQSRSLVRACRPVDGVTTTHIALAALDVDEVRQMVQQLLGAEQADDEFASFVHRCTAGVPRTVAELIEGLRSTGHAPDEGWDVDTVLDTVDVPLSVRRRTVEPLSDLPVSARRLAEAAAVLGAPAPVESLAAVAGLPAGRASAELIRLLRGGILVEVEGYRYGYPHLLAQRAVYRELLGPHRQQLHRKAVRMLEKQTPRPLAQLAEHSRRAGQHSDWLRFGYELVDDAMRVADVPAAIDILTSMLDGQPDGVELDRIVRRFCVVAPIGVNQYESTRSLEALLAHPGLSEHMRGEVRISYGLLLVRQAHGIERGRSEIEAAVAELRDRSERHWRGMALLALPYLGSAPVEEHERWMRQVEAVIEQCEPGELRTALLANTLGTQVHLGHDTVDQAIRDLPTNVSDLDERRALGRVYVNLADGYSWVGHNTKAEQYLDRATHLSTGAGGYYSVGAVEATRLRLDWAAGRWEGLDARAEKLIASSHDLYPLASEALLVRGWLAVARGDWQEAERFLTKTETMEPNNAIFPVLLGAAGGSLRMLLEQGAKDAACARADRCVDALVTKGGWVWAGEFVPYAVEAYCAADRFDDARELTDALAAGIDALDAPLAEAALAGCLAVVEHAGGDAHRAADLFESAQQRHAKLGFRYRAAQLAESAAACRWAGDEPGSSDTLAVLADQFEGMGATRDAARCRHWLRHHGIVKSTSRGARSYGDVLSPREREVARLVSAGHTNQEIADIMFLSRRTVEEYVGKVLRKYGVRSRRQLLLKRS